MMFPGLEIFKSRQDNEVQATPLQVQRTKQIESLQIFNQHVSEINHDVKYRVSFTADNQNFTLLVILPPNFPQEKPVVSIWPPSSHPWIHPQNLEIIECPGLNKFTMHADLGQVVNNIVREFQSHPPVVIRPKTEHGVSALVRSARSRSYSQGSELLNEELSVKAPVSIRVNKATRNQLSTSQPSLCTDSHSYLELSSLNYKELKNLHDNEDKLRKFIKTLPACSNLHQILNSLNLENETLARNNLELEPQLNNLRKSLIEKYEVAGTLQSQFEELMEKHKFLSKSYSPPSIRDQLHDSALKAEDESENIAENFCSGQIPLDEFLKNYMNVKTQSYHRKAKAEKLTQQLEELNKTWY